MNINDLVKFFSLTPLNDIFLALLIPHFHRIVYAFKLLPMAYNDEIVQKATGNQCSSLLKVYCHTTTLTFGINKYLLRSDMSRGQIDLMLSSGSSIKIQNCEENFNFK